MSNQLRIIVAQVESRLGDIEHNTNSVIYLAKQAQTYRADIIVFPELFLLGYPPEDLLYRPELSQKLDAARQALSQASYNHHIGILVGSVDAIDKKLYNSAWFFANGNLHTRYHKHILPNYGVFDERRYFTQGNQEAILYVGKTRIMLMICEDVWEENAHSRIAKATPDLVITINASPFEVDKLAARHSRIEWLARQLPCHWLYANLYGAQDDLIFDGGSFCYDNKGKLCSQAREHAAHFWRVDYIDGSWKNTSLQPALDESTRIFYALSAATKSYVHAANATRVVIGLSGGIDSAVTLAIAVAALGPDNVHALCMPYIYTRTISIEDAKAQAHRLKVSYQEIPIHQAVQCFSNLIGSTQLACTQEKNTTKSTNTVVSVTEQNIQSRCRGIILMAISNASGALVLATGNKSELAMGYATLYGDLIGAYAVLKDVDKHRVYKLANWCNRQDEYIISRIITREPSAELAPNQRDSDSLPNYDNLDALIRAYIEKRVSLADMMQNYSQSTLMQVIRAIDSHEYKRRQAPLGPKITELAFGRDRRMPLANHWKHQV